MHCMALCMLKAHPGQRWSRLFVGDSEGCRELPLGSPPHTVSETQVDGFKPAQHYRVAGRKESASEWYEITINVPIPEASQRKHLSVVLDGTRLSVKVAGWMEWERTLQQRLVRWEDMHESRTHVGALVCLPHIIRWHRLLQRAPRARSPHLPPAVTLDFAARLSHRHAQLYMARKSLPIDPTAFFCANAPNF